MAKWIINFKHNLLPNQLFLLIWFPLTLLLAGIIWAFYNVQATSTQVLVKAAEKQAIRLSLESSKLGLSNVRTDLLYLADVASVQNFLATDAAPGREKLAIEYLAFVTRKGIYDQLRLLDEKGQELVRVNWNDGQPAIVSHANLQNKFDRYYVKESLALRQGEVYVSPLDLNVEHGAIEQPVKPTIRFGTPVFDRQGRKRGIIVLNYLGKRLIGRIQKVAAAYTGERIWLLNSAGYWLLGPRPEDEWGFMYPDRMTKRLETLDADAWKQIQTGGSEGQFLTSKGLYTYAKVEPFKPGEVNRDLSVVRAEEWYVVAHQPQAYLVARNAGLTRRLWSVFGVLELMLTAAVWTIAYYSMRRREAQERYRELVNNLPVGIYRNSSGQDGHFMEANPAIVAMFEADSTEQFLTCSVRDLYYDSALREMFSEKIIRQGFVSGEELELVTLKGRVFWAAVTAVMKTDNSGNLYFDGVIEDISKRKEIERQLQLLNDSLRKRSVELEAANHELEAFSYSVSHDLRAPLRAIDGFSRILQSDYAEQLGSKGGGYLERIRRAAQHMGLLIDDLLKLSRVTRAELVREKVNMSELASELIAEFRKQDPERVVHSRINPELAAYGDRRLIRVVLDNLLNNAWKFTGGRAEADIEFGVNLEDVPVWFVRDNGAGFDMNYADKLFGVFQRLHDASEFPGTGVGLATVQRIIHKHGGRIWAESTVDAGTTFYFTLASETEHER